MAYLNLTMLRERKDYINRVPFTCLKTSKTKALRGECTCVEPNTRKQLVLKSRGRRSPWDLGSGYTDGYDMDVSDTFLYLEFTSWGRSVGVKSNGCGPSWMGF